MATFHQHTTGEEAAKAFTSRIRDKTFIITGPSEGGIGAATATAIAHGSPRTIFLTGRTISKIQPVIEAVKAINASIECIFIPLDLSDLDSVRVAAKQVLDSGKAQKIHGLINNAGVMAVLPYAKTKQGIELQFGTNHIGHFLWTNLLLERVLAAKDEHARIVNVSSGGYITSDVRWDDYNFQDGKTYHPWTAYGASKTANVLFTTYLASHLKSQGIDSFALQPGMPRTPLYIHTEDDTSLASFPEASRLIKEVWGGENNVPNIGSPDGEVKTLETAASTVVVAVADPRFDGRGGAFLRNCQEMNTVVPYVTDPVSAERLWKLSEELVGQKFMI